MVSFENWTPTTTDTILANKESFATNHPVLTLLVLVSLLALLVWIVALRNKKENEAKK